MHVFFPAPPHQPFFCSVQSKFYFCLGGVLWTVLCPKDPPFRCSHHLDHEARLSPTALARSLCGAQLHFRSKIQGRCEGAERLGNDLKRALALAGADLMLPLSGASNSGYTGYTAHLLPASWTLLSLSDMSSFICLLVLCQAPWVVVWEQIFLYFSKLYLQYFLCGINPRA